MELERQVEAIIEPALEDMGYHVVRVMLSGSERKTLQVMIDRQDGAPISVDDCALASRTISVLMDVEDPISDQYVLEVSSPGLDRPLVKPRDFMRFQGENIKFETKALQEGRKRFKGVLKSADEEKVEILLEDDHLETFSYGDIQKVKLIPDV